MHALIENYLQSNVRFHLCTEIYRNMETRILLFGMN
jgi:hypothetical protein